MTQSEEESDKDEERRQTRTRAALARGVGGGRTAARRVHAWTRTPLGRAIIILSSAAAVMVAIFALIGIPLIFRGTPVRDVSGFDGAGADAFTSPAFHALAEFATRTPLDDGASIEILNDGNGFFPRLWQDLRGAQRSITVVNYYAADGVLSDTLALLLSDRSRAGVRVFFVYDPIGSMALSDEWFDRLRESGVRIAEFRPLRWYRLDRANHRTHARGIVIDGEIAYTGGYGFDDRWRGDGRSPNEWRETNVRLTGSAVGPLQAIFVAHWAEAAGELLLASLLAGSSASEQTAAHSLGPPNTHGSPDSLSRVGVLYSQAGFGSSTAERALAFSVATSQRTLFVANSYFVPDDDFVRLLCDADVRGVDVRVLTNSDKSDVPIVWLAGRHRYNRLLACGIRIYEYQPTVLHSKTLVVDGAWSLIGTINFDNRSLAFNDEVSVIALDRVIGARMDSLFHEDLGFAQEIEPERFAERGFWQKLREAAADLVSRWL
jgi:cardiolipin synthase